MEVLVSDSNGKPIVEPRIVRAGAIPWLLLAGLGLGSLMALLTERRMWGPHLAYEGVAFGCFAAMLVLEARRRWLTFRVVVVATAVLFAFALAFPPGESADVWSFVMYGRIVLHGDNPYTTPPNRFPEDRWLHLVRPVWRNTPSLYGPAFDLAAAGMVRAASGSALRVRFGFQLLALLGVAGILMLLWRRTHDPGALAVIGLNPLVGVGVVNGAHNDALLGLAILAGVVLAGERRRVLAGLVLGVAALIKVVALLPVAIVCLWMWRRRGTREAVATGSLAVAVALAGYLALGDGSAVHAIGAESGLVTRFSLWRLASFPHSASDVARAHYLRFSGPSVLSLLPMAAILLVAILASIPGWKGRTPDRAVGLAVLAYLLAAPYVMPWYLMWVLPVLALAWRSRLVWIGLAQQAALTVAYAVALHKHFGPVGTAVRSGYFETLAVAQAVAALTLAFGWAAARARRHRPLAVTRWPALAGVPAEEDVG